jgi:D-alanyl-D-alanine carboxypeptidase
MLRFARVYAALVLYCTVALLAPARGAWAPPSPASPQVRAAIDAAVEKERKVYGGRTPVPAILVGVWDGAGRSYVRGFGYADVAKRRPLSSSDHFRIGSNTKTFVVSVLLQLVDEGKLRLDDPVSRFSLGVTIPNGQNITVRELCQMRSGLFDGETPETSNMQVTPETTFDSRTMVKWAMRQKPYFAPNKGYRYNNTGYLILGLIIESLTKDTVANQIRKRLTGPFGLTQTTYPSTMAMPAPWAHGYGLDKNRNWEDVSNMVPISLMGAAGAMISDMTDSRRWIKLYVTGKATSAAMHRALMDCLPTGDGDSSFGLGIGCTAGWYGYTGGLLGYNTANWYFPADDLTVVAWVSTQNSNPHPGVANAVIRDIARIMTPAHIPFVRKAGSGSASSGL